jgi:hypothetical protein
MSDLYQYFATFVLACVAVLNAPVASAQENNQPPEGFTALFNGKDIEGWTGGTTEDPVKIAKKLEGMNDEQRKAYFEKIDADINKNWSVDNGELVSTGKGLHLVTPENYADFEMWVDWKLTQAGGDSGIYVRDTPQVQIWDPNHKPAHKHGSDKGSGGLWNNKQDGRFPAEVADKPIGQWNRMYIRMVGPYCTVVLNGKKVVDNAVLENYFDRKRPVYPTGRIHLQTHGSETRFRNVFVREIEAEESNKLLKQIAGNDDAFTPIFNGKDFTGWVGTRGYEVKDGVLWSKHKPSSKMMTEQVYGDFIARLDFLLTPGANNGLIIRSPKNSVAIELQVLDDSAKQYANLKPYQFHGSIYGIQPAIRGYLRPVGQWNTQEVRVVGDHIQVYLNGYLTVDAHLDKVAPNHKGAQRRSGHFGFAGHSSEVAFRDIKIKQIEGNQQ